MVLMDLTEVTFGVTIKVLWKLHLKVLMPNHRLIIKQDTSRQVADLSSVKLNLTDPAEQYCASTAVEGCQAGRLGPLFLYMCEYNAESPKHDRKRFTSQAKTKYIADLGI